MFKSIVIFFAFLVMSSAAQAERISSSQDVEACKKFRLCIHVSQGKQRMYVWLNSSGKKAIAIGSADSFDNGGLEGELGAKISTARSGKSTPLGTFKIEEVA